MIEDVESRVVLERTRHVLSGSLSVEMGKYGHLSFFENESKMPTLDLTNFQREGMRDFLNTHIPYIERRIKEFEAENSCDDLLYLMHPMG